MGLAVVAETPGRVLKPADVRITLLDGIEHTFRFDANAMAEIEELLGALDTAFETLSSPSPKTLRQWVRIALLHENEALTAVQAGKLYDFANSQLVAAELTRALVGNSPPAPSAESEQTSSAPTGASGG